MKKANIQRLLSKYFIILVLFLIGITSAIFSVLQYISERRSAIQNLQYSCSSIGENIELRAKQLDTVVLNTISSNALKETAKEFSTTTNSSVSVRDKAELSALLTSLKGFEGNVRQLSVYPVAGTGYGVGDYIGITSDYVSKDWFQDAYSLAGKKYIYIDPADPQYVSVARAYYDEGYRHIAGIAQAQMYYDELFHSAIHHNSSYDLTVIVYDADGEVIYPISDPEGASDFSYLDSYSDSVVTVRNTVSGKKELVAFYRTDSKDFTVMTAVRTGDFALPLFSSLLPILMIFLVASFAGIILSNAMSHAISNPIESIYAFLSKEGNEDKALEIAPTNIVEIDQLVDSINDYITRSEEQTQKIVSLNQQEIQAQMLALQSQMNPHFLYNSLASISEMAKQGMTDEVTTMTVNISQILRYISSNKEQVTTIEEELELCDMYLECMKLRFGDDLTYSFEVNDDLLEYMIPKLCIQLLVENAIKSVSTQAPPWNIKVVGYKISENWFIAVKDNGPGFDPEVEKHLRSQMDTILETKTLPSLKIEGMGILNIFIRFYLLDGIKFLFDFGNNVEGGAFVTVGRKIADSEQEEREKA